MAASRRSPPKSNRLAASAVVKPTARQVPSNTRLFLYVHAGGRCEFDGCNDYLLEHHVTKTPGNYAEMAHIYAFNAGGPRAKGRRGSVHDLTNLMLLCPKCHKEIDDNSDKWTVAVLRRFKRAHEDRVYMLTGTSPDRDTTAVLLRGLIAGKPVAISAADMQDAVAPRYVSRREACEIDLTAIPDSTDAGYWEQGAKTIRLKMQRCYEEHSGSHPPRHVSVFALAPIPLLMVLGECLSDKVPTDLYQRHRDSQSWRWKSTGEIVSFATERLRVGTEASRVALIVALSGGIAEADLPNEITGSYSVYRIAPTNAPQGTDILKIADSLRAFGAEYRRTVRQIVADHPKATAIDVFPAVPAPIAVAMGRDLLPKRDPILVVFDFNKARGGFTRSLEINRS